MQTLVELISSLKQVIYSRLAQSAPAKRCATTTGISAGAIGLHGTPPDPNMQILLPRPPGPDMPPPPPPNFNYNRELVPYPDENYSETKELLKVINLDNNCVLWSNGGFFFQRH